TYDRCQSTTSWAAADSPTPAPGIALATHQHNFKTNSPRDSTKTSCSPIQPSPSLALQFGHSGCGNLTRKSHPDARSSTSTDYVPGPRPTTSGRLRKTRDMPRLEARTSSDTNILTQNSHGSLFVEQSDPASGSSLLNHSATYSPAPSSPLRIPSSPGENHIGNLRVAAKLESRSYRTGFFPETDSSNMNDFIIDENVVTGNVLEGTQVSGFILEDEDSEKSLRENQITPDARASDSGLEKSTFEQTENTKPAVIVDSLGISDHHPSQASSFPANLEHATAPQGTITESHSSSKNYLPKSQAEGRSQAQKGETCETSNATKNGTREKKSATALPGPLYEEEYPIPKFANAKYAVKEGSMASSPVEKNARTGLRMGRQRISTIAASRKHPLYIALVMKRPVAIVKLKSCGSLFRNSPAHKHLFAHSCPRASLLKDSDLLMAGLTVAINEEYPPSSAQG
ncbi:hypothetical protein LX36DRAFT_720697, partial [Colletotrichum falcatum]